MQQNFDQTTSWLLVHEGGYVNHPDDPGGATNRGVIQRTYDAYRRRKGLPAQSVRNITTSEVMEIYRSQYWNTIMGDELPAGLDYALYDFSVNSGPSRAVRFLQELLHVTPDGVIGNMTLAAIRGHNNIEQLIQDLCVKRWNWMKTLKTFKTFGKGWTRRVMGDVVGAQPGEDHGVIDRAVKMAQGLSVVAPLAALPGKALEEDVKMSTVAADAVKDDKSLIGVGVGAIPATLAGLSAVPEGPLQWALAAILVVGTLAVGYVLLKKWQSR